MIQSHVLIAVLLFGSLLQEMYVYISEDSKSISNFTNANLVWEQGGLIYGDWSGGANSDGIYIHSTEVHLSKVPFALNFHQQKFCNFLGRDVYPTTSSIGDYSYFQIYYYDGNIVSSIASTTTISLYRHHTTSSYIYYAYHHYHYRIPDSGINYALVIIKFVRFFSCFPFQKSLVSFIKIQDEKFVFNNGVFFLIFVPNELFHCLLPLSLNILLFQIKYTTLNNGLFHYHYHYHHHSFFYYYLILAIAGSEQRFSVSSHLHRSKGLLTGPK